MYIHAHTHTHIFLGEYKLEKYPLEIRIDIYVIQAAEENLFFKFLKKFSNKFKWLIKFYF